MTFWDSSWSLGWRLPARSDSLHLFICPVSAPSTHPHIYVLFFDIPALHRLASPKLCRPRTISIPELTMLITFHLHLSPRIHHHHHPTPPWYDPFYIFIHPYIHTIPADPPYPPSHQLVAPASTIFHAPDRGFLTAPASRNPIVGCCYILRLSYPFFVVVHRFFKYGDHQFSPRSNRHFDCRSLNGSNRADHG
jgi:hypothetical protein